MRNTALIVPLLLTGALGGAQEHHDRAPNDPFTLKPLSGDVYALYGRGGNVGFYVGPDAVVVVDSQFKDLAPGIVEKIKSVTDKPIKYLVNTHPRNWKTAGEGPEYEAAWALGADTGVGDLDAVIKANWLCNDLGMDPISMGATLAAAMELYERGVLTDRQVEPPLRFGSAAALVRMTEATAYRASIPGYVADTAPGDVIAFDLHTWHASFGGRDRLAWTAVYQSCPETTAERDRTLRSVHDSFEQAFRGFDRGRYPVWRDWLAGAAAHPRRAEAIGRMRHAGVLDLPGARDGW